MHRFLRWYNQNRVEFIIGVALIAFIFIIIKVLNGIVGIKAEEKRNEIAASNSIQSQRTIISRTEQSVLTGDKVPEAVSSVNKNLINTFVEYCNTGKGEDIEKAYNLLSDECKEVLYPTLRDFVTNYYLKIFYITRIYSLENWYTENNGVTYYIKYTEDVLATGNAKSADTKSDYITIVSTNKGYRLNIGSYVGRTYDNETVGNMGAYITVNYIDMYIDYCIVNVSISNNSTNTICFDTKENVETVFLYDENNVKYNSFLNEIEDEEFVVKSGESNTLNIRFNKIYNPSRVIRGIYFSDIVLNYENYAANTERKQRLVLNT